MARSRPLLARLPSSERLEALSARLLGGLPEGVARRLAGPPRVVDGLRLDPNVQLLLRAEELVGAGHFEDLPPPEARAEVEREARVAYGRRFELPEVRDEQVAGATGPLSARLYVPHPGVPSPLVVYLHGGGWVVGSLESTDSLCRYLARESGCRVLSVAYRLAPEHPFPAPLEDAVAAFTDAHARTEELGAAPGPVGIAGDSAGGNLAAATSLRLAAAGGPVPGFQLLFYPVTDVSKKTRSYELFSEGYFLTERQMDWYRGHYLAREQDAFDPAVSPLLSDDASGAPPAHVVTAGFDVLRDEGEAYVDKLRDAGVAVSHSREEGLIHAFINAVGISPVSREAVGRAAAALRAGLAAA